MRRFESTDQKAALRHLTEAHGATIWNNYATASAAGTLRFVIFAAIE